MIIKFGTGPHRDLDVAPHLSIRPSSATFSKVGRN